MNSPQRIGIVGMGLLGRGIAACSVARGLDVAVHSTGEPAWKTQTRDTIEDSLRQLREHNIIGPQDRADWQNHYSEYDAVSGLAGCDFIIESVPEHLPTKLAVLRSLEGIVDRATPIATNTSTIPISHLQAGCAHGERLIGMHFAMPCYATRFLEIIRGQQTNDETVAATFALAGALEKQPSIVQRDVPGFIANRLGYAMYREALHLLETGVADAATIDDAFRNSIGLWAGVVGPFGWMDMTGLPSYADGMARVFPDLSNSSSVPPTMRNAVRDSATSSRGFRDFTPEQAEARMRQFQANVWRQFRADG